MSAQTKYRLEAFSFKHADVYRVDILEEGYTGAITYKNIGAGRLRLSKSEGIIQKTTLAFSIQADTNFEYIGFFQYNNRQFPVKLYKNNVQIWSGFLVSESYSESYINPPYDVELVATDGLGFLENETFENAGSQSYLAAIDYCLAKTGLVLDYSVIIDLYENRQVLTSSMLDQTFFNGDIFDGETCTAVIEKLLPYGCILTQQNNRWLIRRPLEDAEKTHFHYVNSGSALTLHATDPGETALVMGDKLTGQDRAGLPHRHPAHGNGACLERGRYCKGLRQKNQLFRKL